MPVEQTYECTYCGADNNTQNEKCTKCGKHKDEDAEEYQKHLDTLKEN